MKLRGTAIALLMILLLGLVLGIVSLFMKNNALSGFALFFILAGVVGNFAMRRGREQQAQADRREKERREALENDGAEEE